MDDYVVEIDELREDLVVLAVPVLRLLVFGRSIDEAMTLLVVVIARSLRSKPKTSLADLPPLES